QNHFARKETDAAYLRSRSGEKLGANSAVLNERQARRRDELAAHFSARKRSLLDQRDRPARLRQQSCAGRSGGASSDHDRIVGHGGSVPIRRARKLCVKGGAGPSCNRQSSWFGHSSESSLSRKPARTLTRASWRVTPLQPIAQRRRLPIRP